MTKFVNNKAAERYEYHVDNSFAFANYHFEDKTLFIDYVEAPHELRGTGAAGELMKYIMEDAKKENRKVYPICGYAVSWLRRHSEYDALVQ